MAGILAIVSRLDNLVLIIQVLAGVIHPIAATEEAYDVPEMSVTER